MDFYIGQEVVLVDPIGADKMDHCCYDVFEIFGIGDRLRVRAIDYGCEHLVEPEWFAPLDADGPDIGPITASLDILLGG